MGIKRKPKWDAKTRKAIRESIKHWEENKERNTYDLMYSEISCDSCELCALFTQDECQGCPVRLKTGLRGCGGSPWASCQSAWFNDNQSDWQSACQAEIDFLRSLL
jgi:hypothetical protein